MTIDPDRPALHTSPGAKTDFARDAKLPAAAVTAEKDRVERSRLRSVWPTGEAEDTDLERRVLAHERILQALIAHIAEAEPKLVSRLSALFSETSETGRREHDYADTHAYADQFMQNLVRLLARRAGSAGELLSTAERAYSMEDGHSDAASERRPVTLLEVGHRSGIWAVTKDGQFFGHYIGAQPAFDAAEAAAFAVVASGGAADVTWDDAHSPSVDLGRAGRPEVTPAKKLRTVEFRAGSARVVR